MTVRELEEDPTVRGFVLGSAMRGVFSAGFHLPGLLCSTDGDNTRLVSYVALLQETWLTLYTTPLATVAAIPGDCPAGGCLLALSYDARVMVESKGTIGLDSTQLGLVPPKWLARMLADVVGVRRAEAMVQRGLTLPPADALAAGLVDATVPLSSLAAESNTRIEELLAVPDLARSAAKQLMRNDAADTLRASLSEDLDEIVSAIARPGVQARLREYVEDQSSSKKD